MRRPLKTGIMLLLGALLLSGCHRSHTVWLDDLDIQDFSEGISTVIVTRPSGKDSIRIGDRVFERGIGIRYISVIPFNLDGKAARFRAWAGPAGQPEGANPLKFFVVGDRKILFESREMKAGDEPERVDVDLKGIGRLGLLITNTREGGKREPGYWAMARFTMTGPALPYTVSSGGEKYILTPPEPELPRINSARTYGARPRRPFLFRVAATGKEPLTFSAENLPASLSIDPETGIITGQALKKGSYSVGLKVRNAGGETDGRMTIVIGDTLALTPPMGWNGWNAWAGGLDREKVLASADAIITSGLIRHGWSYINIDDTWEAPRAGKYNAIQPNAKFPGFPEMIRHIHSLGLKFGVYSTPWICTYQGFPGATSDFPDGHFTDVISGNRRAYHYIAKYSFEKNDAEQMAAWGVDFLKYDWHIRVPAEAKRMELALRSCNRDIVYSLSNSAPFAFASDWAGMANLWRTGSDIRDSWISLYSAAFTIDKWAPFAGPGHWNDPDMMVLGNISTGAVLHPTRLTPDEQYTHMSIFCLLSAPLIIGCPIDQLDDFTRSLLTNDEILQIDQDPLGKPARLVSGNDDVQVWLKPMADGSFAAGLFNVAGFGKTPQSYFRWGDEQPVNFTFDFAGAGLRGRWKLRDAWRQKDLGETAGPFKTVIPYHGVIVLRMFPAGPERKKENEKPARAEPDQMK